MSSHISPQRVKFAHVSDVHLSTTKKNFKSFLFENISQIFKDVVQQINEINDLDFTIFTGDLTDEPNKKNLEKFCEIAAELKKPYYLLPGNHDVNENFKKKTFNYYLRKYCKCFTYETNYHTFIHNGFAFLLLDNSLEKNKTGNGLIHRRELKWLDRTLKKNKNEPIMIFQHFPADRFFNMKIFKLLNLGKFLRIINKYDNIVGVFSGHTHFSRIKEERDKLFVSTPSLIQYPMAYRVIKAEVDENDELMMEIKNFQTRYKELISFSEQYTYNAAARWQNDAEKVFVYRRKLN